MDVRHPSKKNDLIDMWCLSDNRPQPLKVYINVLAVNHRLTPTTSNAVTGSSCSAP